MPSKFLHKEGFKMSYQDFLQTLQFMLDFLKTIYDVNKRQRKVAAPIPIVGGYTSQIKGFAAVVAFPFLYYNIFFKKFQDVTIS